MMKDKYVNPFTDFDVKKLFDAAQIACFDPAERKAYEKSLKYYRDLKNVTDTAWEEGKEEGIALGSTLRGRQVATELLKMGTMSDQEIARVSGLSLEDVMQVHKEQDIS